MGEEGLLQRLRAGGQDHGRDRLRPHRPDGRREGAGPGDERPLRRPPQQARGRGVQHDALRLDGRAAREVRHHRPVCARRGQTAGGRREHRENEGRRGHHQRLPRQQRGRGGAAGGPERRQGKGRRSGRLAQREGSQLDARPAPLRLLHPPRRRRHRGGPETHRRGAGGHRRGKFFLITGEGRRMHKGTSKDEQYG